MNKFLITFSLLLALGVAHGQTCHDLMRAFVSSSSKYHQTNPKNSLYTDKELSILLNKMRALSFSEESQNIVWESLNYHKRRVEPETISLYLEYTNTFRGEKIKTSLMDIAQLGQYEVHSPIVADFDRIATRLPKKYFLYKNQMSYEEYSSLYFSCKSAIPNPKNNKAKEIFSKFSIGFGTMTSGLGYAYTNKDKDMDFEWWSHLGYEVGFNAFTSYLGAKIQTNQADSQQIKSLKSYFNNRLTGLADVAMYPMLFPADNGKVKERVDGLKGNPHFDEEIKKLHKLYDERGLFTKFKYSVVELYRELIRQKQPISVGGINWDNLTEDDLDRPEVQEVLTLAATAELYELNRGPLLDTGDVGIDRYLFSSMYSAVLIPRNMIQSYLTYQILCMGQKNPATAIIQASVFKLSVDFFIARGFYTFRKKTINQ